MRLGKSAFRRRWILIGLLFCSTIILFISSSSSMVNAGLFSSFRRANNRNDDNPYDSTVFLYYGTNDSYPIMEQPPPTTDANRNNPPYFFVDTKNHRVVEFYAHWCYHCQHFRSHYIEIAQLVTQLISFDGDNHSDNSPTPDIKFYAVSCVANSKVCNDQNIFSYPTIQLYASSGGNDENNNNTNSIGQQPIASLLSHAVTVESILHSFNMTVDAEKIKSIKKAMQDDKSNNSWANRIWGRIKSSNQPQKQPVEQPKSSLWPNKTMQQIYDDIYLSFDYNLRYGIFSSNDALNDEKKDAFHKWLLLLLHTLPKESNFTIHIRFILDKLIKNFNYVIQSEHNLISLINQYPHPTLITTTTEASSKSQWSDACSKGRPGIGYTCGLWQLFHITTIGFVEYSTHSPFDYLYQPIHVAETINNFIQHFFQCEECRYHFLKEYNECAYNRCNRFVQKIDNNINNLSHRESIELSIWLIEFHNGVNVRLLREKMQRERQDQHQDSSTVTEQEIRNVMWPSNIDCPQCWYNKTNLVPETTYNFLHSQYWPFPRRDDVDVRDAVFITSLGIIPLLSLGTGLVLFGLLWYCKRYRRYRSGRHKRSWTKRKQQR